MLFIYDVQSLMSQSRQRRIKHAGTAYMDTIPLLLFPNKKRKMHMYEMAIDTLIQR